MSLERGNMVGQVWRQRFADFDDLFVVLEPLERARVKLLNLETGGVDYAYEWHMLAPGNAVWERIA